VFVSRVTAVAAAAAAWSKSDFLASPQGTTTVWKQGGLGKGLELKKGMKDGRRRRSMRVAVIRDSSVRITCFFFFFFLFSALCF
jgi:hypothetical protein